jgi:hypothetical protein
MCAPSAPELLRAWERGLGEPPPRRALVMLRLARPDDADEQLGGLSVGQRDAYLLDLRERSFGRRVVGTAACPGCGEQLELDFDIRDVRAPAAAGPDGSQAARLTVAADGYEVRLRPLTIEDLLAGTRYGDFEATRRELLYRCVVAARRDGGPVAAHELPSEVVELIDARLAEMDPQADVRLALSCPECGRSWDSTFDIAGFLWTELNAWAARMLYEIHLLASAYCWREAEILALSPARRRFYLEAVSG